MRGRAALSALCVATLVLAACGRGSGSTAPTTTATGGGGAPLVPVDVCGLISNRQIAEVGGQGEAQDFDRPPMEGVQWDSCSWGDVLTPPVITIHVEQVSPNAPLDPLRTMVDALASAPGRVVTPVDVGTDGRIVNVALLSVGGGVGTMIVFRAPKGELVVVSATGTEVDVPALTALAKQMNAELA